MNSNLKIGKLILITLFLNVLFLQAQTNKDSAVHGVVTTSQGESLAFATVMVKDTKYATLTNEEGEFELELPYGTHTITVS